jgi:hypothetical protein
MMLRRVSPIVAKSERDVTLCDKIDQNGTGDEFIHVRWALWWGVIGHL